MCAGCFSGSWYRLCMPWATKKKSTEMELPEVSAHLCCAITHWHTATSRYWEVNLRSSQWQRLLRMLWSRNPMRWDGWFTSCDISDVHINSEIVWKITNCRSNQNRLCYGHRERSSNPGSVCSFCDPSSIPERGHWRCAEDYPSMRGSLNPVFELHKTIDQIIH